MDTQNTSSEIDKLASKLQKATLPANLHDKAFEQIERINLALKYGGNLSQLDITTKYIDWISGKQKQKMSSTLLKPSKFWIAITLV